jgi:putative hydrolase of the HAD superfamily
LVKRAVFFDLGGTLLVMRRDRIISTILTEAGHPSTPNQVRSAYYQVEPLWLSIYGGLTMKGQESEESYRQLDRMVFRKLFAKESEGEADRVSHLMRKRWVDVEKSVPRELFPDAIPTLARLKADGYVLGLVSNATPDTVAIIESLGLPDYFPVIVVSGIVGVSKPNPEIFRIALQKAGAKPEETVHVGDLYAADIVGARNAGITGVLIDRWGEQTAADCPRIAELGEVYQFLR